MSSTLRFATLLLSITSVLAYDCPLPRCETCLPDSVRKAPGVGFELTTNYGTSSVKHFNGSISDVAVVPASAEYTTLIAELSQLSSPPASTIISRTQRRLNHLLGRPGTATIGALAEQITSLQRATSASLGHPLSHVAVSTPYMPGLEPADLNEAIVFAGLESWLQYPLPYPRALYAPDMARAAQGSGLCKQWKDVYACWEEVEEEEIPLETVLGVEYTNKTLIASVAKVRYAFDTSRAIQWAVAKDLGMDATLDENDSEYWENVTRWLNNFKKESDNQGTTYTQLVLIGESAGTEKLRKALKDAMGDSVASMVDVEKDENTTWAASRGAASYARIRQEVPWDCKASPCEESEVESRPNDEL